MSGALVNSRQSDTHLSVDRYGAFVLTDAVRPGPGVPDDQAVPPHPPLVRRRPRPRIEAHLRIAAPARHRTALPRRVPGIVHANWSGKFGAGKIIGFRLAASRRRRRSDRRRLRLAAKR